MHPSYQYSVLLFEFPSRRGPYSTLSDSENDSNQGTAAYAPTTSIPIRALTSKAARIFVMFSNSVAVSA